MNTEQNSPRRHPLFERVANAVTRVTGSTGAFMIAFLIVIVWLITGPIFNYSDTWQLVINTGTTVVTFLMVFLIQKSQNKESLAIQLKLNELVAANRSASNRLVSIEDMTEEELRTLQKYYNRLAQLAMTEKHIRSSHSIEEAEELHEFKKNFKENKPAK
jgi:low affinity Fe/Cu permease